MHYINPRGSFGLYAFPSLILVLLFIILKQRCGALFVISKATFTKTASKPKFVDRFSFKKFSAAIDQCSLKSPNFVSIENFLSYLT